MALPIRLIAAAAAALGGFTEAQAQTSPPPDSLTSSAQSSMSGGAYQGLPGVWVNRGNHLWYCQWQGNAAPRNQHIVCDTVDLPAAPPR